MTECTCRPWWGGGGGGGGCGKGMHPEAYSCNTFQLNPKYMSKFGDNYSYCFDRHFKLKGGDYRHPIHPPESASYVSIRSFVEEVLHYTDTVLFIFLLGMFRVYGPQLLVSAVLGTCKYTVSS